MVKNCCGTARCFCALEEGTNVTITGTGDADNPFVISSTGGGGGGSAASTTFAPTGTVGSTNVQAAIAEVSGDVTAEANLARNADNLTSGTVADARIASTIARDTEVTAAVSAHTSDTSAAHAASAIAVTPFGTIAATDVQAALQEIVTEAGGGGHVATRTYNAPGGAPGYDTLIELNYDPTSGSIPESVMIKAWDTTDTLEKAFWINEAGQPRVWTVSKDEPGLKMFAFGTNGSGNVITVQDQWGVGDLRWAINGKGQVVLGELGTVGGSVIPLGELDPVPVDLPDKTLIVRTGAGGSVNEVSNGEFGSNVSTWSNGGNTLAWQSGTGSDGVTAGFARLTATGTGSRNIQSQNIPCAPGAVYSVECDVKWQTGTPKDMSIMIRYLDAGLAQITNNIGPLETPGTVSWETIQSLNATAPALTEWVQVQIRMNSAAVSDAVNIDDVWLNQGATVDRSAAAAGTIGLWNGASEVLIYDGSVGGGGPVSLADITDMSAFAEGLNTQTSATLARDTLLARGMREDIVSVTGAGAYNAVLADEASHLQFNNASAQSFVLRLDSVLDLPTGSWYMITRLGAGTVSIDGTAITMHANTDPVNAVTSVVVPRYGQALVRKRAADTWIVTLLGSGGAIDTSDFVLDSELDGAISGLAAVASSGQYSDLLGEPVLPVCKNATKPSNQAFTTATFADDTHLTVALPIGTHDFEVMVHYDGSTNNDAKFQFQFDGTSTVLGQAIYARLAAAPSPATASHSVDSGSHNVAAFTGFGVALQNAGAAGVGTPMVWKATGRLVVTVAGNFRLQVGKQANTDTGVDTRTMAGSYMTTVQLVTTP